MDYQTASYKDGVQGLLFVRNMYFMQDPNFFVEPWENRGIRHRAVFEKTISGMVVYTHIHPSENFKDLDPLPDEIYLYGAFNEVTVHQIRSRGKIREMTDEEMGRYLTIARDRLSGKPTIDPLDDQLQPKDGAAEKALYALRSGKFYRFEATSYANKYYERG